MKRTLTCTLVVATILSFALSASARKKRKPYEDRAGDAGAGVGFSVPVTDDGNGFLMGASGSYQVLDHLDVSMSLGMVADENSNVVPRNPVVSVGTSIWPTKMKRGWGGYLSGRLRLGLGLFGVDNDQRRAASLGMMSSLSWLKHLPEHLVVSPRVSAGLSLGAIRMGGGASLYVATPVHHTTGRDTELAMRYDFGLGTGWGDRRGGLGVGLGMTGLSELTTGEEENRFTLDLGVSVRFRVVKQNSLRIGVGLSIPLGGDFMGTNVVIGGSVSWGYSVEIYEEENSGEGGESTGWRAPYGIWRR